VTDAELGPPLDWGRSRQWPDGMKESLDRFRQGHLLDDVPAFYLASATMPLWDRSTSVVHDLGLNAAIAVEDPVVFRRAVLLTQACDVMKDSHPWVTAAPAYDAGLTLDPKRLGNIRARNVWHLYPLDPPWASDGQVWVADLRLEVPVEKTLLLKREPLEAFADDAGYALFVEHIAGMRRRPALAEACYEHVITPMFDWLKSLGTAERNRLMAPVAELRVQPDHPTTPKSVTVFVVLREEARAEFDRGAWEDGFAQIYARTQGGGVTLQGPEVDTLWDMSARDYVTSVPVEDSSSS